MSVLNAGVAIYMIHVVLFFVFFIKSTMASSDMKRMGSLNPFLTGSVTVVVSLFLAAIWPIVLYLAIVDKGID